MSGARIAGHAARSVPGSRRASNQDRYAIDHELGFVLLADGVAGRPAGDRAADIAIQAASVQLGLKLRAGPGDLDAAKLVLEEAFRFADVAVQRAASRDERLTNMATTLVGVAFVGGYAVIGGLGDSRLYRLRHELLKQVTTVHRTHQGGELAGLSTEEAAAVRPLVQRLTRAVGHRGTLEPDVSVEPLWPQDLFLLCSNGLSDVLDGHRIAELMLSCQTLEEACERLVATAIEAGADDDVTAVLVRPANGATLDEAR
jgi:serine/threonine protein phosphatase PrpC